MLFTAMIPPAALAQANPPATPVPRPATTVNLRVVERLEAVFDPDGNLADLSTVGRVFLNNTANYTILNLFVNLSGLGATNLSDQLRVPELPPGERLVQTYGFTGEPRVAIRQAWRSLTYDEKIRGFIEDGTLDNETAQTYADTPGIFYGVDNELEFNITLVNTGADNLTDVRVGDLLPEGLQNVSFTATTPRRGEDVYGGLVRFDAVADSVSLDLFPAGTTTTFLLRGTLPAVRTLEESVNLEKDTTVSYAIETSATQGPASPLAAELQRATQVAQAAAQDLSTQIPDVSGYTTDLTWVMEADDVDEVDGLLPDAKLKMEGQVASHASMAGSAARAGASATALLAQSSILIPPEQLNETINRIADHGLPPNATAILRRQGLTDPQMEDLRRDIIENRPTILNTTLQSAFDQIHTAYLDAATGHANVTLAALENAVYLHRLKNRTTPATPADNATVSQLKQAFKAALGAGNWTNVRDTAQAVADWAWNASLRTGEWSFVDVYHSALYGRIVAELGLAEDEVSALKMVQTQSSAYLFDDPPPVGDIGVAPSVAQEGERGYLVFAFRNVDEVTRDYRVALADSATGALVIRREYLGVATNANTWGRLEFAVPRDNFTGTAIVQKRVEENWADYIIRPVRMYAEAPRHNSVSFSATLNAVGQSVSLSGVGSTCQVELSDPSFSPFGSYVVDNGGGSWTGTVYLTLRDAGGRSLGALGLFPFITGSSGFPLEDGQPDFVRFSFDNGQDATLFLDAVGGGSQLEAQSTIYNHLSGVQVHGIVPEVCPTPAGGGGGAEGPPKGTLTARSTPQGAEIILNNESRGTTNTTFSLDPGSYTLFLNPPEPRFDRFGPFNFSVVCGFDPSNPSRCTSSGVTWNFHLRQGTFTASVQNVRGTALIGAQVDVLDSSGNVRGTCFTDLKGKCDSLQTQGDYRVRITHFGNLVGETNVTVDAGGHITKVVALKNDVQGLSTDQDRQLVIQQRSPLVAIVIIGLILASSDESRIASAAELLKLAGLGIVIALAALQHTEIDINDIRLPIRDREGNVIGILIGLAALAAIPMLSGINYEADALFETNRDRSIKNLRVDIMRLPPEPIDIGNRNFYVPFLDTQGRDGGLSVTLYRFATQIPLCSRTARELAMAGLSNVQVSKLSQPVSTFLDVGTETLTCIALKDKLGEDRLFLEPLRSPLPSFGARLPGHNQVYFLLREPRPIGIHATMDVDLPVGMARARDRITPTLLFDGGLGTVFVPAEVKLYIGQFP